MGALRGILGWFGVGIATECQYDGRSPSLSLSQSLY